MFCLVFQKYNLVSKSPLQCLLKFDVNSRKGGRSEDEARKLQKGDFQLAGRLAALLYQLVNIIWPEMAKANQHTRAKMGENQITSGRDKLHSVYATYYVVYRESVLGAIRSNMYSFVVFWLS